MFIRIDKQRKARSRLPRILALVLVVWALTFALAPTALFAAPHSGHVALSVAHDDTNYVSRGRVAQQVADAAGFHEDPGAQIFEDVPPNSHYYQWVNRLANRDIIGGYACGTEPDEPCVAPDNRPYFRPDVDAFRGHIAKMVSNAAGFDDTPTTQTFQDVLPGSTYYLWAERLAERGLMDGFPCGTPPAGPCIEPDNKTYFRAFEPMAMSDLVKVVNDTFHGN